MESSTRARTYRALRPNFTSQADLQCIHSFDHLKSLARFVTSSHHLRVETGRWDRPPVPYAQRECQICDIEIEDEFHFMFVCPLYNADRTKLLPRYYRINPSMQIFINLMNETNARLINRVAKFVYKSFKTRTAYFSQHWNSYVYVVISTDDFVSVSVAWIFLGTPLKANGVPGSVPGNLTALQLCELCADVSCIVCYIINDTKIQNSPVSHLLFLWHVDAIAIMSTYSLVRACGPIECEIKFIYLFCRPVWIACTGRTI